MSQEKCKNCELKDKLEKAIEAANKAKEHYESQIKRVNGTLAKYTKKMDEIDGQTKKG